MAISSVGFAAQATQSGSSGVPSSVTPALPAGIQQNDFMYMVCSSRKGGGVVVNFSFDKTWDFIGQNKVANIQTKVYRRFVAAGETPTQVTADDSGGGWSAQIGAYRGVSLTSPIHAVKEEGHTNTQDFQPGVNGVNWLATTIPNTRIVSAVATEGDCEVAVQTANGFTARQTGGAYSTPAAPESCTVVADKVQAATTTAVTFLVWRQVINFPDFWAGVSFALAPAPETPNQFQEAVDTSFALAVDAQDVYTPTSRFGTVIDLQRRRISTVVG